MCPSKAANSRVSRSACLRRCCSKSCWCCCEWRVRFHRNPFFVESVEFGLDSISPAALDPVLLRVWRYYRCVAPGRGTVPETPCPPRSTSVLRRVRVHPIIYLIPLAAIVAVSAAPFVPGIQRSRQWQAHSNLVRSTAPCARGL